MSTSSTASRRPSPSSNAPATPISSQSIAAISAQLLKRHRGKRISLLAPLVVARKGYYTDLASWANGKGFSHLRVDGTDTPTDDWPRLDRYIEHDIDLPVATLIIDPADHAALDAALEQATAFGNGAVRVRGGR